MTTSTITTTNHGSTIYGLLITLNPDCPKVLELLERLQTAGLNVEIFPAVDGRGQLPKLEKDEVLDQQRATRYRGEPLTGSEIGCYLSHLRAVKRAAQLNWPHVCIFEDDIELEPSAQSEKLMCYGSESALLKLCLS